MVSKEDFHSSIPSEPPPVSIPYKTQEDKITGTDHNTPLFVKQIAKNQWFMDPRIISNYTNGDQLLLQNALHGHIITSKIFPLIWPSGPSTNIRTMKYLSQVTKTDLDKLTWEDQILVGISLRDLVYAHEHPHFQTLLIEIQEKKENNDGSLTRDEVEAVIRNATMAMPETLAMTKIHSTIPMTPWPTKTHQVLRWIQIPDDEHTDDDDDEQHANNDDGFCSITQELFIKKINKNVPLIMAFCNAQDLCYHNMENVVNLEPVFQDLPKLPPLQVKEGSWKTIVHDKESSENKMIESFQIQKDKTSNAAFSPLQNWTTFIPPINDDQRGGKRFIFYSQMLADQLTNALQPFHNVESTTTTTTTTTTTDDNDDEASYVINPVFRLNRFESTDDIFESHYDLPYYDSIQKQKSTHTLLLYLSPGRAEPALRIRTNSEHDDDHHDDVVWEELHMFEGIIFHQSLQHEGRPFLHGTKLFLRTELLIRFFDDHNDNYDEEVARMFNIACYTSIFHQELKDYTTKLFNHSVICRYEANNHNMTHCQSKLVRYKYFYRVLDGISYITNGHDYWFLEEMTDLKMAAMIVILDYFHGDYKLRRFQNLLEEEEEESIVLDDKEKKPILNGKAIFDVLWEKMNHNLYSEGAGKEVRRGIGFDCFDPLPPSKNCTCPMLCDTCGTIRCSCPLIQDIEGIASFNDCLKGRIRHVLDDASILIYNGTLRIHCNDVEITNKDIRFRSTGYQERVWYAACATGWACDEVIPVKEISMEDARSFHLPPIRYRKLDGGYHLIMDMFQNGWVERNLRIPYFDEKFPSSSTARRYAVANRDMSNLPQTLDH